MPKWVLDTENDIYKDYYEKCKENESLRARLEDLEAYRTHYIKLIKEHDELKKKHDKLKIKHQRAGKFIGTVIEQNKRLRNKKTRFITPDDLKEAIGDDW